eukprot:COSAG01_NODE_6285_length_3753_cov_7.145047_5_plen_69_part_00
MGVARCCAMRCRIKKTTAAVSDASLDYPSCPTIVATLLGLLVASKAITVSAFQVRALPFSRLCRRRAR